MNGQQTLIRSQRHATVSSSARRIVYVFRLLCGGAVGGFFLGSVLGSLGGFLAGIVNERWETGAVGVLLGGFILSTIGAAWGMILGLTDSAPVE